MLWAVIGRIGLGFVMPSLNLGSMHGLPDIFISQGSSTINFLRQLGGAVGIGLVGNVLEWRLRTHPSAPVTAYHETFALIGVITACAVVAACPMGPTRLAGRRADDARRMNLGIGELPGALRRARRRRRPGRQRRRAMAGPRRPRRGAGRPARLPARQGLRRRPDRRRHARPDRLGVLDAGAGRGAALGDARLHRPARRPHRRARLAGGAAEEAPRRDRLPRRGRGRRAHVRAGCASSRRCARPAASSAPQLEHGERDATRCGPHGCVLATGAQPQATLAAGLCERRTPSGIALRGYVSNPAMTPRITSLEVVWHKRLAPGYGWIFPVRRRRVQHRRRRRRQPRVERRRPGQAACSTSTCARPSPRFQSLYAPARELIEGGEWQGCPARR